MRCIIGTVLFLLYSICKLDLVTIYLRSGRRYHLSLRYRLSLD